VCAFESTEPCGSTVFKTASSLETSLDHSRVVRLVEKQPLGHCSYVMELYRKTASFVQPINGSGIYRGGQGNGEKLQIPNFCLTIQNE